MKLVTIEISVSDDPDEIDALAEALHEAGEHLLMEWTDNLMERSVGNRLAEKLINASNDCF